MKDLVQRDITEILADLPKLCALRNLTDGKPIIVKRGETGYWPAPNIDPDAFNARRGITPAQVEAMRIGSMFGFHVPGADPLNCEGEAA